MVNSILPMEGRSGQQPAVALRPYLPSSSPEKVLFYRRGWRSCRRRCRCRADGAGDIDLLPGAKPGPDIDRCKPTNQLLRSRPELGHLSLSCALTTHTHTHFLSVRWPWTARRSSRHILLCGRTSSVLAVAIDGYPSRRRTQRARESCWRTTPRKQHD
jgi:hypothetical protein